MATFDSMHSQTRDNVSFEKTLDSTQRALMTARESFGVDPGRMEALTNKLQDVYNRCIKPVEQAYKFDDLRPSTFEQEIAMQRPLVTFFGPWSAGKTTFINYLLRGEYLLTGPQPTTESYTAVIYGPTPSPMDGEVMMNSRDLPFRGLNNFGAIMNQRFKGYQVPHPLLRYVTLVDTPGVLDGAHVIRNRGYDYPKVARWFAERSDLIFVIFDPAKLDAGAELQMLFTFALKGLESRVRIVLNKADNVNSQELLRVYGGLYWTLSSMVRTTEPPRVYVGSFWDKPYNDVSFTPLFVKERADLLNELVTVVPQHARDRKVAAIIRSARAVLMHALVVDTLAEKMPLLIGKARALRKSIVRISEVYETLGKKYNINPNDFPAREEYEKFFEKHSIEDFPSHDSARKMVAALQTCIDTQLPSLLRPMNKSAPSAHDDEQREQLLAMYSDDMVPDAASNNSVTLNCAN